MSSSFFQLKFEGVQLSSSWFADLIYIVYIVITQLYDWTRKDPIPNSLISQDTN